MTCKDCIHHKKCREHCVGIDMNLMMIDDHIEKLCDDFKDKQRFIELPCKVGDTVYKIEYEHDCVDKSECPFGDCAECGFAKPHPVVREIKIYTLNDIFYWWNYFGKTMFAAREEAENVLKNQKENENEN